MRIEWQENKCFLNGREIGRIMLYGNRWRAERFFEGYTMNVGWRETAREAMAALERNLGQRIPLSVAI